MVLFRPPHRLRHPTATRIRGRESLLCWLGHPAGTPPPPPFTGFFRYRATYPPHALRAFLEKKQYLLSTTTLVGFFFSNDFFYFSGFFDTIAQNRTAMIWSDDDEALRNYDLPAGDSNSGGFQAETRSDPGLRQRKGAFFYRLIDCSVAKWRSNLLLCYRIRSNFLSVYVFSRFRMSFEWFLGVLYRLNSAQFLFICLFDASDLFRRILYVTFENLCMRLKWSLI